MCLCELYLKVTAVPASHPRQEGGRDPDTRASKRSCSADAVARCQKAADSQNTFLTVAEHCAVGEGVGEKGGDRPSARCWADG